MPCVLEDFAKSFKVIRHDTLEKGVSTYQYFVGIMSDLLPFLRYSALNNDVSLKSGLGVIQAFKVVDNDAVRYTIYDFLLVCQVAQSCTVFS